MDLSNKTIRAVFILEAIGRPPEYLIETLNGLVKSISEEKGVKVVNHTLNPPVEMKNQKDFYTSFVEIEVELEHVLSIAILMFKYMPAHIEVISPEHLTISNAEMGDLFSELTRRLHGYEELARIMQNEKIILETKLREVLVQKQKAESLTTENQMKEADNKKELVKKEKKSKK
jgi:hypothetical protein